MITITRKQAEDIIKLTEANTRVGRDIITGFLKTALERPTEGRIVYRSKAIDWPNSDRV